MGTVGDEGHLAARRTRRLHLFVVVGLLGLLLISIGLALDIVIHALDPDLASEESLFSLENPGHLVLAIGIAAAVVGLGGAASILIDGAGGGSRLLRFSRLLPGLGLAVLAAATIYVAVGPGFGHGHDDEVAGALALPDGTRLSSSLVTDVDRSRLPESEALALAALAWSRDGSLDGPGIGHDHVEEFTPSPQLTTEEQEALQSQLALAASIVPLYDTVAEAEAAGYVQSAENVDGVGRHFVKWSLVDRPFDPEYPSMLLFEVVKYGEEPVLVGLSYWVTSVEAPEGFAGDTDEWHQHFGLCFEGGWLVGEDISDRGACGGDWINGSDLWMLHAWVVPGMENRLGVFAARNPKLCERSCG